MARATSVKSRINGTTNAYLGNSRTRMIGSGVGNRLASHSQNYRRIRTSMGLSAG